MTAPASAPPPGTPLSPRTGLGAVRLGLGICLLAAALMLPARGPVFPADMLAAVPPLGRLPAELPGAIGLLLLCRGRLFRPVLAAISTLAALLLFLKLADLGTSAALGRPFNPLFDLVLVRDGWNLLSGMLGLTTATAAVAAALLAWLGVVALMAYGLAAAERLGHRHRTGTVAVGLALLACSVPLAAKDPGAPPAEPGALRYLAARAELMRRSARELAVFETALESDPLADLSDAPLFAALEGRHVYVLFVESYGRTVLSNPAYRARIAPRLLDIEQAVGQHGYGARSGWMTSPTVGGQSWLAHAALLSGLPVTDQSRYGRMIASPRKSLSALFRQAGWRTVAVMPAITMDWPEGDYYGFDAIYPAGGLGYKGLPFNWVTMPDQYTLAQTQRIVAESASPVMVAAALISSHAPWTPIPVLVPWEKVGDGSVFNAQALSGDPPATVWAEPDRVRAQYLLSVDYTLAAIGEFIARFGDGAVFVVVGDHQPAQLVTGDDASRDVPFHILSNDPAVLGRLAGMHLADGMLPAADRPAMPMWSFREAFVRAVSASLPPSAAPAGDGAAAAGR